MGKSIDLRVKGFSFEEAAKHILAVPAPKKTKRKKPAKNVRLN